LDDQFANPDEANFISIRSFARRYHAGQFLNGTLEDLPQLITAISLLYPRSTRLAQTMTLNFRDTLIHCSASYQFSK
jgi:hypothetical protein